jgi:ABC-type sugar transport system ATPase subunit
MTFLEIRNIVKEFGGKPALKNISFEVSKGELFSISGPPTAGKTTLLKIVSGLLTPDSGKIYLDGNDITETPPSERNIGMLFEIPPVYPNLTGFENIAFPLRVKKLPESEIRKEVLRIAELLGIKHLLDRYPSTYSGGEYQRVGLARALVRNPKVLLLDEPFRNLDAKIQEFMRTWLKKLQKEIGITVIHATHDPLEAMAVGDRVGIMLKGELKQVGRPDEVYLNPMDIEVTEYITIPAVNLFDGVIRIKGGFVEIDVEGVFSLRKSCEAGFEEGEEGEKEVIVGIRPHDLRLDINPRRDWVKTTLALIQPYGSEVLLLLKLNDKYVRAVADKTMMLTEGAEIYINIDPKNIMLFDRETKRRITI